MFTFHKETLITRQNGESKSELEDTDQKAKSGNFSKLVTGPPSSFALDVHCLILASSKPCVGGPSSTRTYYLTLNSLHFKDILYSSLQQALRQLGQQAFPECQVTSWGSLPPKCTGFTNSLEKPFSSSSLYLTAISFLGSQAKLITHRGQRSDSKGDQKDKEYQSKHLQEPKKPLQSLTLSKDQQ